jgi:hypothetical protein
MTPIRLLLRDLVVDVRTAYTFLLADGERCPFCVGNVHLAVSIHNKFRQEV